jgi:hypothetical protein
MPMLLVIHKTENHLHMPYFELYARNQRGLIFQELILNIRVSTSCQNTSCSMRGQTLWVGTETCVEIQAPSHQSSCVQHSQCILKSAPQSARDQPQGNVNISCKITRIPVKDGDTWPIYRKIQVCVKGTPNGNKLKFVCKPWFRKWHSLYWRPSMKLFLHIILELIILWAFLLGPSQLPQEMMYLMTPTVEVSNENNCLQLECEKNVFFQDWII